MSLAVGTLPVGRPKGIKHGSPKKAHVRHRRIAAGLCCVCGVKPLVNTVHCADCRERSGMLRKQRMAGWRAAGLCSTCGDKPRPGRRQCVKCAEKFLRIMKQCQANKVARGLCCQCGKRPIEPSLMNEQKTAQKCCRNCYLIRIATRHFKNRSLWQDLLAILDRQGWKCAYTGVPIILGVNDSIDHIYPVSRFPERKYDITNIEWVSLQVNKCKREYTRDEFLALVELIASRNRPATAVPVEQLMLEKCYRPRRGKAKCYSPES